MWSFIGPLVLYPHYVVTFAVFWLLLVYLDLVSLSDARKNIALVLPHEQYFVFCFTPAF